MVVWQLLITDRSDNVRYQLALSYHIILYTVQCQSLQTASTGEVALSTNRC